MIRDRKDVNDAISIPLPNATGPEQGSPMSAVAVAWSLEREISSGPKALLHFLAWRSIDWIPLFKYSLKARLAEVLRVTPRTIQRRLKVLEEEGLIIRRVKPGYQPQYILTGGETKSPNGGRQNEPGGG